MTLESISKGFAGRLKQALDDAGYKHSSRRNLGKLFGVTPQAVYKWLTGSALPSSSRAPHVAEVLGVRKAWLFDGEEPMRARLVIRDQGPPYEVERDSINMSSLEYRLLAYFRGLSSQQRKVVMDLLASMQRKSQEEVRENLDGES